MSKNDVTIAHHQGVYSIKVAGRASFASGIHLRDFARNLKGDFEKIAIDLEDCTGMDSTFMGILAMIGLRAKSVAAVVEIINASAENRRLLKGLGLEKLFNFAQREICGSDGEAVSLSGTVKDQLKVAKTVVDAHQTLIDVDEDNLDQFADVVKYAQDDVDRLEQKNKN